MRRRLWVPIALSVTALLLAACSSATTTPPATPAPAAPAPESPPPSTKPEPTPPSQAAIFSGRMLIATAGANSVAAMDPTQSQVMDAGEIGPNLHGISMLPGGKSAVVASQSPNSKIRLIDPVTLEIQSEIQTSYSTHHTWTDPKGRYVYVTAMPDQLLVVDTEGRLAKQMTVGKGAYGLAASRDGSRVYVTLQGDNAVAVVNADTLTLEKTIPVPGGVNHITVSPDGSRVYTTLVSAKGVAEVDVAAGQVTRTFDIGGPGHGIDVTADGQWVYASSLEGKLTAQIDLKAGTVKELPAKGMPNHVALSPDQRYMFVTVGGANQIQAFDTATQELAATLDVGMPPHEFTFVDAAPPIAAAAASAATAITP